MLHVFTEYQGPTEDTPGLKTIAMPDGTPVRRCGKGRYEVVLKLCEGQFVTLRCLAEIINRQPIALQNQYLSKLVRDRKLSLAFPTKPTHERQAYCTSNSLTP